MEKFLALVADVLEVDVQEISMNTEYDKFEAWDSLHMLSIILEVEDEYGISISLEAAGKIRTLQDIYDIISTEN